MLALPSLLFILSAILPCLAQSGDWSASWPHDYPGKPKGEFSPEWQDYYLVKDPLPHVAFNLGRNWAGSVPVDQKNRPNDTLFFWGFEKVNGSLTAKSGERTDEPWAILVYGGFGGSFSTLISLIFANGPFHLSAENGTVSMNSKSWQHLADMFWVDHRVGLGYSTAEKRGPRDDSSTPRANEDFWSFVGSIVKVFPSLAQRPLYLIGEYSGAQTVVYFSQHYFSMKEPPTKLSKIALGDPFLDSYDDQFGLTQSATLSIIEAYPQLIGYNTSTYENLKNNEHQCGLSINLTYPQQGTIPFPRSDKDDCDLVGQLFDTAASYPPWKDFKLNLPFKIDPFSVADLSVGPGVSDALSIDSFLNDDATRAAIHAPTSKNWSIANSANFDDDIVLGQRSAASLANDLAKNASDHKVSVVIFNRNDDLLFSRRASEIVIQNTTFGGMQGFSRRPSTAWTTDDGKFAGIVHQERSWTFGLLYGRDYPDLIYTFLRQFVFGNNQAGLVSGKDNSDVHGGENSTLAGPILRGPDEVLVYNGTQTSTYIAPSQTIAAWNSYFSSTTPTPTPSQGGNSGNNGASTYNSHIVLCIAVVLSTVYFQVGFLRI